MSLIVQKYGGTSLADASCIHRVAKNIIHYHRQGHSLVVVVSAMKDQTNNLEALAKQLVKRPIARELDVLLATGEQVSIALLSMVLHGYGCLAKSYTGSQVPIRTDNTYTKARILDINESNVREDLKVGTIVIVAGFQGIDPEGNITTLGRGGSDTTAVALAAKLQAEECQIYTDVEGVYTSDPHIVPKARLLPKITFEEMLELASLGAKVLQIRAVEFAGKYNVPIRVLSTFQKGSGTLITFEDKSMEQPVVSGITFNRHEARLLIRGVPDIPGIASNLLQPISDANIEIDMIIQNLGEDLCTDFTFTVHRRDYRQALEILKNIAKNCKVKGIYGDDKIAKVSLVGVGMRSHAGIASTMFSILGKEGINIQLIATSEIKISVVIAEKYLELGVQALHEAFELHNIPVEENTLLAAVM